MAVCTTIFSQLASVKHVVKSSGITNNLLLRITNRLNHVSLYSTNAAVEIKESEEKSNKYVPRKMNKAMMAYLERAKAHDDFMKKERQEYEVGKRHLANMMGEDPELFQQEDVDRAIEYLFPSGLFDKHARPIMKPPETIFPPRKAAEFDGTGRPFHSFFYTTCPNYYQALYDIVEQMQIVNKIEDENISKGIAPDPSVQFDPSSSDWIIQSELEKMLLEEVYIKDYEYFIATIQRLANHPYSYHVKDFLMKYRKLRQTLITTITIPELEYDSDGRPFITVPNCQRKTAFGSVTLRGNGTGKLKINGKPLVDYFPHKQNIEQRA